MVDKKEEEHEEDKAFKIMNLSDDEESDEDEPTDGALLVM